MVSSRYYDYFRHQSENRYKVEYRIISQNLKVLKNEFYTGITSKNKIKITAKGELKKIPGYKITLVEMTIFAD